MPNFKFRVCFCCTCHPQGFFSRRLKQFLEGKGISLHARWLCSHTFHQTLEVPWSRARVRSEAGSLKINSSPEVDLLPVPLRMWSIRWHDEKTGDGSNIAQWWRSVKGDNILGSLKEAAGCEPTPEVKCNRYNGSKHCKRLWKTSLDTSRYWVRITHHNVWKGLIVMQPTKFQTPIIVSIRQLSWINTWFKFLQRASDT